MGAETPSRTIKKIIRPIGKQYARRRVGQVKLDKKGGISLKRGGLKEISLKGGVSLKRGGLKEIFLKGGSS